MNQTICLCGWKVFNSSSTKVLQCPQCDQQIISTTEIPIRSKTVSISTSHWNPIHKYPVEHRFFWDPKAAKTYYGQWCKGIPTYNCRCKENWEDWTSQNPPDFSDARAFFVWIWKGHNHVSTNHVKPPKSELSLEDAKNLWGWKDNLQHVIS